MRHVTLDLEAVTGILDDLGFGYAVNADGDHVTIPDPEHPGWSLRILLDPENRMLRVVYPLPGAIPEERVDPMVLAANEANARTLMGAWVVNTQARELAFVITVCTDHTLYTDQGLLNLMQLAVGAVEAWAPRFDRVLKGEPLE